MTFCVASISPVGDINRQLYSSTDEARAALIGELKMLRSVAADGDAETINGVLDEIEAVSVSADGWVTYFEYRGMEWAAWYNELPVQEDPHG